MILQKYRKQLSDKAITLENGGQLFFVPISFEHRHISNELVDIEFPKWFSDKYGTELQYMEISTNHLTKRLCDLG